MNEQQEPAKPAPLERPPLGPVLLTSARPFRLLVPFVLAVVVFFVSLDLAPADVADDRRHAKYAPMFGTAAQVIATLFVALALEARYVVADAGLAILTVSYVAIGLTAAVVAGSPGLPEWAYGPLLGATFGGGVGALASALMVAAAAITAGVEDEKRKVRSVVRGK